MFCLGLKTPSSTTCTEGAPRRLQHKCLIRTRAVPHGSTPAATAHRHSPRPSRPGKPPEDQHVRLQQPWCRLITYHPPLIKEQQPAGAPQPLCDQHTSLLASPPADSHAQTPTCSQQRAGAHCTGRKMSCASQMNNACCFSSCLFIF